MHQNDKQKLLTEWELKKKLLDEEFARKLEEIDRDTDISDEKIDNAEAQLHSLLKDRLMLITNYRFKCAEVKHYLSLKIIQEPDYPVDRPNCDHNQQQNSNHSELSLSDSGIHVDSLTKKPDQRDIIRDIQNQIILEEENKNKMISYTEEIVSRIAESEQKKKTIETDVKQANQALVNLDSRIRTLTEEIKLMSEEMSEDPADIEENKIQDEMKVRLQNLEIKRNETLRRRVAAEVNKEKFQVILSELENLSNVVKQEEQPQDTNANDIRKNPKLIEELGRKIGSRWSN